MTFDPTRVKAICFDVDGTLSDTDDNYIARVENALRGIHRIFPRFDLRSFSRWLIMVAETPANAVYHWLDVCSLDDNLARLYEKLIRRRKHIRRPFWLMNGANELLADLAQRYPLSIVSARDEGSTRQFVEQFSLERFFHTLVCSHTCEHTKPYAAPVLYAAGQMKIAPENIVMIGDTTVDILAGKRAGAQTIGLLCGFGKEKELLKAGADLVVKDLVELKEIFAK
jgi:HAD superfamily hydrolase (TIGR01549 family)